MLKDGRICPRAFRKPQRLISFRSLNFPFLFLTVLSYSIICSGARPPFRVFAAISGVELLVDDRSSRPLPRFPALLDWRDEVAKTGAPPLAGQHAAYIESRLAALRRGKALPARRLVPERIMTHAQIDWTCTGSHSARSSGAAGIRATCGKEGVDLGGCPKDGCGRSGRSRAQSFGPGNPFAQAQSSTIRQHDKDLLSGLCLKARREWLER
jgi:hypothetical protein